jgi:uncharacterized repeat protein (TIGR03803 family)
MGLLAACVQQSVTPPLQSVVGSQTRVTRHGYTSLYSFTGESGAFPNSGLAAVSGALYGTTPTGGASDDGVVFEVDASGYVNVLYNFTGKPDGAEPEASLVALNGQLYGTTRLGGAGSGCVDFYGHEIGCGTVFKVNEAGTEQVVYSFRGGMDGAYPQAGLLAHNGVLYGTTTVGGGTGCRREAGCGTIFEVTPAGKEHVLYRFKGGADGAYPQAYLVASGRGFYGTTLAGGDDSCDFFNRGCGTVFELSASGKHRVVYTFKGGSDAARPTGQLVALRGMFYGTARFIDSEYNGAIFKVSASGTERVIYRFKGSPDGAEPFAGLTRFANMLYGTTYLGGRNDEGTLFVVSVMGRERVLYSFAHRPDGRNPAGRLLTVSRALYGVTKHGGSGDCKEGCGTVFRFSL